MKSTFVNNKDEILSFRVTKLVALFIICATEVL